MSRKKTKDRLITGFILVLGTIARAMSNKSRVMFGRFIGDILRLLSKSRSDITLTNIKNAFPDKGGDWCSNVRDESYRNLGITLVELLTFPYLSENKIHDMIKYENIELINEANSRGKGIIFMSGHFGNWELLAYTAGLFSKIPITIVVKPQSNHFADEYLNEFRTRGGNKIVPMSKAARTMIQALNNHEAVALLADQSADWQKDIFVDFFGRPAATYEAPARLALKYRSPLILGFAHRQKDYTYKVTLREIDYSDLDNSPESIIELTRRHVKILEENILLNPGHWAWQHKRWKHEPPK